MGIMQKARISVHTGAVKDFIGQFHVDITATSTSELSDEILARKIQDTSGSGTRVLDEVCCQPVINLHHLIPCFHSRLVHVRLSSKVEDLKLPYLVRQATQKMLCLLKTKMQSRN